MSRFTKLATITGILVACTALLACGVEKRRIIGDVVLIDGPHADSLGKADDGKARTPPKAIFLNREGGRYEPTYVDDPARNESALLGFAEIPAFDAPRLRLDDEQWQALVGCVTTALAPYAVEVTDSEPEEQHVEVVLTGGSSSGLGFGSVLRGIAPSAWRPSPQAIVFVFGSHPELWDVSAETRTKMLCWTAVHEAGHTFALDHSLACASPMHPLGRNFCGKSVAYLDADLPCATLEEKTNGDYEVLPSSRCMPSFDETQNEHQLVLGHLGPKKADSPAPETGGADGDGS